jgi:hypothetical protein
MFGQSEIWRFDLKDCAGRNDSAETVIARGNAMGGNVEFHGNGIE